MSSLHTPRCLAAEFGNCKGRPTDKSWYLKNQTGLKHLYLTVDFLAISREGWRLKELPGAPFVKGDDGPHVLFTHGTIDRSHYILCESVLCSGQVWERAGKYIQQIQNDPLMESELFERISKTMGELLKCD